MSSSIAQFFFAALFMLTYIVGGHRVFNSHKRRTGTRVHPIFYPLRFNASEWIRMGLVVLLSCAFGVLAVHAPQLS